MSLLDMMGGDPTQVGPIPQTPGVSQMQSSMPLMPNVTGPGMPNVGDPHVGLVDRLRFKLGNALHSIPDNMMPVPEGMRGLLSDDQIDYARRQGFLGMAGSLLRNSRGAPGGPAPSFAQAVGAALPEATGGYQNAMQGQLTQGMQALQTAQALRVMRGRLQMGQQMLQQPGENQADWLQRMRQGYLQSIANGDYQTADALKDVVTKPELDPYLFNLAHPDNWQNFDQGGYSIIRDPRSGQVVQVPRTAAPISPLDAMKFKQTQLQDYSTRVNDMLGKYNEESKPLVEVTNNLRNISALSSSALAGSPQAQLALIDSFLRTINPGGMARPSSIELAEETRSLKDKAAVMAAQVNKGQPLSGTQVRGFINAAKQVGAQWQKYGANVDNNYRNLAGQVQVDPNVIIKPYFNGIDLSQNTTQPADNAPAASSNVRQYVKKGGKAPAAAAAPAVPLPAKPVSALPPQIQKPNGGILAGLDHILFGKKTFPDNMGMPQ